jgi:PAS domain S-box-containing protein
MAEPLLRRVLETGEAITNLELTGTGPAAPGERRTFLGSFFPVRTGNAEVMGIGAILVEVSDLKRAQEALQLSEARLQAIIEHAPAAIFVVDEDGKILLANRQTSIVIGRSGEEIVGRNAAELLPPQLDAEHRATDREVLVHGRSVTVEEIAPSPSGPRTLLSVKFELPDQGGRRVVCGISTDITDRKRMEEELRRAVRAREDVLAIVFHDLRNPLGTVQLSATMLLDEVGDDPIWSERQGAREVHSRSPRAAPLSAGRAACCVRRARSRRSSDRASARSPGASSRPSRPWRTAPPCSAAALAVRSTARGSRRGRH